MSVPENFMLVPENPSACNKSDTKTEEADTKTEKLDDYLDYLLSLELESEKSVSKKNRSFCYICKPVFSLRAALLLALTLASIYQIAINGTAQDGACCFLLGEATACLILFLKRIKQYLCPAPSD